MWIIFFHYIVFKKRHTQARMLQRHRGRPLPSTGQTDCLTSIYFPLTTYFSPKKMQLSCLIHALVFFLCILKFQMELFNTNKGLVSHLNLL